MVRSKDFPVILESLDSAQSSVQRPKLSGEDRRVLIDSITRDLGSIDDAWRRHDQAGLLERIHSLKGALFIVGEHPTANDCGAAEQSIQAQGLDKCGSEIERLKQALRRLVESYKGND
jgi:HPt (histidine-containing phosphotransfer) domain-containing protein